MTEMGADKKRCMCRAIASTPCDCETCILAAQLIREDIVSYEGWANRSTWSVVLHVDNDYGLYTLKEKVARAGGDYAALVEALKEIGVECTNDDIAYDPQCSKVLCVRELDEWMQWSREEQKR